MTLTSVDLVTAVARRAGRSADIEVIVAAVLDEVIEATTDGRRLLLRDDTTAGDVVVSRVPTAGQPRAEVMTVEGAAEYLATTVDHIRALVYTKKIPYQKVGKYLRFRSSDLETWLTATVTLPRDPRSRRR
ncbi:MAG: Helix-turn-helix domain [Acidimicrobiaceae bacterium]|jgi:excisionase family DNA binding protein